MYKYVEELRINKIQENKFLVKSIVICSTNFIEGRGENGIVFVFLITWYVYSF